MVGRLNLFQPVYAKPPFSPPSKLIVVVGFQVSPKSHSYNFLKRYGDCMSSPNSSGNNYLLVTVITHSCNLWNVFDILVVSEDTERVLYTTI